MLAREFCAPRTASCIRRATSSSRPARRLERSKPTDIKKTGAQNRHRKHLPSLGSGTKLVSHHSPFANPQKTRNHAPNHDRLGGFQVFSFGAAKEQGVGKVLRQPVQRTTPVSRVRITEKGVHFQVDGRKRFLSPELSMDIQERLAADIIFAFDECTSPLHPHAYTKTSMERTHRWAARSLKAHQRKNQMLYGIVQGGRFQSLRKKSAKTIGAMPFDGFGIGGRFFGKNEMVKTLASVVPHLPEEKPRHLLGIGTVPDIFAAVEAGIDTFDSSSRHEKLVTLASTRTLASLIFANRYSQKTGKKY